MVIKEINSDEFLISELQNGREEAFDYIFRRYYKGLCMYAKGYVHDLDKAQSLVQDCFVKLWTCRSSVKNIENLSAYLSTMVRNRCVDHIRKVKSTKKLHESIKQEKIVTNGENTLLSREFEESLKQAISLLPKKSKLAFEYSRFDNLTYKQIGEKMNISGKAVEALISRALKMLRKDLQTYLTILVLLQSIAFLYLSSFLSFLH